MCTISRNKFKQLEKVHYLKNKTSIPVALFATSSNAIDFCIAFLKCAWNLEHFEKKGEYPSLIISEIMDCERGGYLNV